MPNELADLSDLLNDVITPQQLRQVLQREDWSAVLVDWVRPVEYIPPAQWFQELAEHIRQHGTQRKVIDLLRLIRPDRAADLDRFCAKWPRPQNDQIAPSCQAEAIRASDEAIRVYTSSPSSARAARPPPAAPPAIPRRWRPPNVDAPNDDFGQRLAQRYGLPYTHTPHPVTAQTSDLIEHQALILLGESGAGKSFELSELIRMERGLGECLSLKLGGFADPLVLRDRLTEFCQSQPVTERRTLYLDGLDEDKTEGQRLGDEIVATLESLRTDERTNLWIRLTSRAASWSADLEGRLSRCLGPNVPLKVLILQPLSEDEALSIAATKFLESGPNAAIERAKAEIDRAKRLDLVALTMNPLTLTLLCDAGIQNDSDVTRDKLYELSIVRLLKERKESKAHDHQPIDPQKALRGAAWFAALSTLAGWSTILKDGWRIPLSVDELAAKLGEDASTLRRVLTTPLFEDAPSERYAARRFAHHSYAEWLTAHWIIHHGSVAVWDERLMPSGGGVPAPLAGVASWLAYKREEWMQRLITKAPALVVTPSLPMESGERRRQIFRSLILAMRSGALFDDIKHLIARPSALTLIGAEDELVAAIQGLDPQEARTVGALVCLVAVSTLRSLDAGQIERRGAALIVSALVDLGLDHERRGYALANRAVSELLEALTTSRDGEDLPRTMKPRWWDTEVARLRELLINPKTRPDLPAEDEANRAERLAYTMELLFPRVISPIELVYALHQPRGHIIGHYHIFLQHELPLLAKNHPSLISPLLGWWTQQRRNDIRWHLEGQELTAWTVAWDLRADPVIWSALVETFYELLGESATPKQFPLDQHDRRRLLLALWDRHHHHPAYKQPLCGIIGGHDNGLPPESRLLTLADLDWWIELFVSGAERMRDEIAWNVCNTIARNDKEAHLQLLRVVHTQRGDAQQALRERLKPTLDNADRYARGEPLPEIPRYVNEEYEADERRRAKEAEERRTSMMAALQPSEPPHRSWWTLCDGLWFRSAWASQVPQHEFWGTISEPERAQAMDRAREYLETAADVPPDDYAVQHDTIWLHCRYAVAAILVLAKFSPSEDFGLSAKVWEWWALNVVRANEPSSVLDQLGPARVRVDPLPDSALRRVFKELQTTETVKAAEHLTRLAQHGRPPYLADELRRALEVGLPEEAEACILEAFTSRDDLAGALACEAARRRLREGREDNEGRWRKAGLALWLSQQLTEADKELLLVWLDDKESLRLLKSHNFWLKALDPLDQLSPPQLTRLYKQIHGHFPPPPPSPEPTVREGSGALLVPVSKDPTSLLPHITQILGTQTTTEAADAIEELGITYDIPELTMRASSMRREVARAAWKLPSVHELFELAGVSHSRVI